MHLTSLFKRFFFAIPLLLCLEGLPARATEYLMSPDGDDGQGSFDSVQQALDSVVDGDVIVLKGGTYYVNLVFPRKAITLRGMYPEDPSQVVLNGGRCVNGASACSVLRFAWGAAGEYSEGEARPRVEGLLVKGGLGTDGSVLWNVSDQGACTGGYSDTTYGGGIVTACANPDLTSLLVQSNHADYGGAFAFIWSSPQLANVTSETNIANIGGGFFQSGGASNLTSCTLRQNSGSVGGGGLYAEYNAESDPIQLESTAVSDNIGDGVALLGPIALNLSGGEVSRNQGNGVTVIGATLTATNVSISANTGHGLSVSQQGTANLQGTGIRDHQSGTGVYLKDSGTSLSADTCTFENNDAAGLRMDWSATATVTGSTFQGNSSTNGAGIEVGVTAHLTMSGSILRSNDATSSGGGVALSADGASASIANCTFEDNTAGNAGGGAYFGSYTQASSISDSTFAGNAAKSGGGMAVYGMSDVIASNLTFTENNADVGGALYFPAGFQDFHLSGATISNNWSKLDGGALYGGEAELEQLNVRKNTAGGMGGGFYVQIGAAPARILDSTFDSNAAVDGGGVYVSDDDALVDKLEVGRTVFMDNTVTRNGGGLYLKGTSATIDQSTFQGNTAGVFGGGLYLEDSESDLNDLEFSANSADSGAGLYVYAATPTASSLVFTANQATTCGGGLYVDAATTVAPETWAEIQFSQNSSEAEGGGACIFSSYPNFVNATFTKNSAVTGAGAYLERADTLFLDTRFSENHAGSGGGGGLNLNSSSPNLHNVVFSDNIAEQSGGGMNLTVSSPNLVNVAFFGNRALGGGGVSMWVSSPVLVNTLFLANVALGFGGGIWVGDSDPRIVNSVMVSNHAESFGGGVALFYETYADFENDILAFNDARSGANFYSSAYEPSTVAYSCFYDPEDLETHGIEGQEIPLEEGNLFQDPGFLRSPTVSVDADVHLTPSSVAIDAGNPDAAMNDPDDTRNDLGIYGGPSGHTWDRDRDSYEDYFWPGDHDSPPNGFDPLVFDCNDDDSATYPTAAEICDGLDNDCDGLIDEDLGTAIYYADTDGDGYGLIDSALEACICPEGYVSKAGDCDDHNAAVHPEAKEICDQGPAGGIDNDCDGLVDDGDPDLDPSTASPWFRDADGDGFGDATASALACEAPDGYVEDSTDCDDSNPDVHPGKKDMPGDGVDSNCDGEDGGCNMSGRGVSNLPSEWTLFLIGLLGLKLARRPGAKRYRS